MSQRPFTCAACGEEGLSGLRGPVPTTCARCRSSRRPSALSLPDRACDHCSAAFSPSRPRMRFCSAGCRHAAHAAARLVVRDLMPCAHCQVWASMTQKQIYCSKNCSALDQNRMRLVGQQVFACGHCGADFARPAARGQRPKWCPACRSKKRQINVPKRVRRAVYERDGWICQICYEPVDRDAAPRTDWSPTVDHIVPRSVAVDDSPENLRLAHHWCNSVRADERAYTAADLAA